MTLNSAIEKEFTKIAQVAAAELSTKLSSVLGQNSKLSFFRLIDSAMTGDRIAIKQDSVFITSQIAGMGPLSTIMPKDLALKIIELSQANQENPIKSELSAEGLKLISNIYEDLINTIVEHFKALKEDIFLTPSFSESKLLLGSDPSSLELPNEVEDSVGLGFKFKIGTEIESVIQVEANTKLIQYLVDQLARLVTTVELEEETHSKSLPEATVQANTIQTTNKENNETDGSKINPRRNLNFMRGVNMELVLELGRSEMPMKDVLTLTRGSAIELDRACHEPVDLYVHNQLIARGEVVAIDDNFGIKILELIGNLDLAKDIESLV